MKRSDSLKSENICNDGTLSLQNINKNLYKDMLYCKRQFDEAKRELNLMKIKSMEMETLVSIINRSWSQLDVVISLILDSLGESEFLEQFHAGSDSVQLLNRLMQVGCENNNEDNNNNKKKNNSNNNNNNDDDYDD